MAEYVMKALVREAGLLKEFEITSGAVSDEEWFNPIYPPAQRKLREKGIPFAHKISPAEFEDNDLVIVMDRSNLRWLEGIVGRFEGIPAGKTFENAGIHGKVHMMMEFAGASRDVADPWYTGDFEQTFEDVLSGCSGLLKKLYPGTDFVL